MLKLGKKRALMALVMAFVPLTGTAFYNTCENIQTAVGSRIEKELKVDKFLAYTGLFMGVMLKNRPVVQLLSGITVLAAKSVWDNPTPCFNLIAVRAAHSTLPDKPKISKNSTVVRNKLKVLKDASLKECSERQNIFCETLENDIVKRIPLYTLSVLAGIGARSLIFG